MPENTPVAVKLSPGHGAITCQVFDNNAASVLRDSFPMAAATNATALYLGTQAAGLVGRFYTHLVRDSDSEIIGSGWLSLLDTTALRTIDDTAPTRDELLDAHQATQANIAHMDLYVYFSAARGVTATGDVSTWPGQFGTATNPLNDAAQVKSLLDYMKARHVVIEDGSFAIPSAMTGVVFSGNNDKSEVNWNNQQVDACTFEHVTVQGVLVSPSRVMLDTCIIPGSMSNLRPTRTVCFSVAGRTTISRRRQSTFRTTQRLFRFPIGKAASTSTILRPTTRCRTFT